MTLGRRSFVAAARSLGAVRGARRLALSACGRWRGRFLSGGGRRRTALMASLPATPRWRSWRRLSRAAALAAAWRSAASLPWRRLALSVRAGASRSATSAAAPRRRRSASSRSRRCAYCTSTHGCMCVPLGSPIRPRAPARPHPLLLGPAVGVCALRAPAGLCFGGSWGSALPPFDYALITFNRKALSKMRKESRPRAASLQCSTSQGAGTKHAIHFSCAPARSHTITANSKASARKQTTGTEGRG